jgi:hypothetical protein
VWKASKQKLEENQIPEKMKKYNIKCLKRIEVD